MSYLSKGQSLSFQRFFHVHLTHQKEKSDVFLVVDAIPCHASIFWSWSTSCLHWQEQELVQVLLHDLDVDITNEQIG